MVVPRKPMTSTACFLSRVSVTRLIESKSRVRSPKSGLRRGLSSAPKALLDGGLDFGGVHVAIDGQHAVVRAGERCVEGSRIRDLDALDAGLGAERVQAVAALAEQRAAHGQGGALEQVVLLRADAGQLHFALALQRRGGKGRVQQHVGHQVQPHGKIAAEDLGVHAKAVVAAVAVDAARRRIRFPGRCPRPSGAGCP